MVRKSLSGVLRPAPCQRLPSVASALLHKRSILAGRSDRLRLRRYGLAWGTRGRRSIVASCLALTLRSPRCAPPPRSPCQASDRKSLRPRVVFVDSTARSTRSKPTESPWTITQLRASPERVITPPRPPFRLPPGRLSAAQSARTAPQPDPRELEHTQDLVQSVQLAALRRRGHWRRVLCLTVAERRVGCRRNSCSCAWVRRVCGSGA